MIIRKTRTLPPQPQSVKAVLAAINRNYSENPNDRPNRFRGRCRFGGTRAMVLDSKAIASATRVDTVSRGLWD
jgi:hypothetical protein